MARSPKLSTPRPPSTRALADLVLEGLRHPRLGAARAARVGLSAAQLAALTDRFVDAGVKALAESSPFPAWLQLGVSFVPSRGERAALAAQATFGEALRRAVLRWRARGLVRRFFFMGKPPGMRLRFETSPATPLADMRQLVSSWLLRQPAVARLEPSIYLAESFQFGGALGVDVAHDYHTADSLLALQATYREQRGTISASTEILSLLIVCDLVRRMTDDSWEAWDLWKRMAITGRRPNVRRETAQRMVETVRPFVVQPDAVFRRLVAVDRRLVAAAYEANERAATAMRRLAAQGQLLFHVREIIPFWVVFHWNRWRVARQVELTVGIEGSLDPRS
jgi:thiopeptide-type bacteriocin biosynthesis protein